MIAIKEMRSARGITQSDLAEIIGTTEAAISRYENGKREPRLAIVAKLADALGCTIDELIEGRNAHARDDSAIPRPRRGRVLQRSSTGRTGR